MAAPNSKKKYGLINPKQSPATSPVFVPRLSVFGDESSSEDEEQGKAGFDKKAFHRATEKSVQKKQTKLDMQRALEQDPTIYEYDQVYDEIAKKRSETKQAKQDVDRKPKYIANLLAQSERRKREYERRTERTVQKEREAEGEEFKDKESFVTASYRAKLEEFSKQDEEEEYRDKLEAFTEVSKQKDLSGFYRHIYRQTIENTDPTVAKPPPEPSTEPVASTSEPAATSEPAEPAPSPVEKRKRQYRPRQQSNADSDSDLSDSSSASSEGSGPPKVIKIEPIERVEQDSADPEDKAVVPEETRTEDKDDSDSDEKETEEVKVQVVKPKVNIWLKRTVGPAFDSALHRYYIRKGLKC